MHQRGGPSGKGIAPPLFLCSFGEGSLSDQGAPGYADRMCRGWGWDLPLYIRPRSPGRGPNRGSGPSRCWVVYRIPAGGITLMERFAPGREGGKEARHGKKHDEKAKDDKAKKDKKGKNAKKGKKAEYSD